MYFAPSVTAPEDLSLEAWWCIFQENRLLVNQREDSIDLPSARELAELGVEALRTQYLGTLDERPCYSAEVEANSVLNLPGFSWLDLRKLFYSLPEELFLLAGRAFQVMNWERTHQYCGQCGQLTQPSGHERARVCPQCGLTQYPRISPAIIVAISNGRSILLAHAPRFPEGLYSVLAGFVEAGETFEECVRREVQEEVGVEVTDIRYFGSQPWPFPHSLMVGFTAAYAGGEICVDREEILDAAWFQADNLPAIPGPYSIARQLIDNFVKEQTSKSEHSGTEIFRSAES
ncbi:MAG: NAD(+) diphosphatase [bacterium]|nr:NAD(+) diphosphatase [bacterium]